MRLFLMADQLIFDAINILFSTDCPIPFENFGRQRQQGRILLTFVLVATWFPEPLNPKPLNP